MLCLGACGVTTEDAPQPIEQEGGPTATPSVDSDASPTATPPDASTR